MPRVGGTKAIVGRSEYDLEATPSRDNLEQPSRERYRLITVVSQQYYVSHDEKDQAEMASFALGLSVRDW